MEALEAVGTLEALGQAPEGGLAMETRIHHVGGITADRLYAVSPLPPTLTDVLTDDEKRGLAVDEARKSSMRTHPFEGEGPYCDAWLSGSTPQTDHGSFTFGSRCGWPADMHPQA